MINEEQIKQAAEVIVQGGVVVYPTETAYGIGVDATNGEALENLYDLKDMPREKPTHLAVANIDEANKYVVIDERARTLAKAFMPGPLTIVLPSRGELPEILEESGKGTVAFRIPDNEVVLSLIKQAGCPITATSANRFGDKTPYSIEEVKESFGNDSDQIAAYLDVGELPYNKPSTIVSLVSPEPKILREGPISEEEIREVLGDRK